MKFLIKAIDKDGWPRSFHYDPMEGTLLNADGTELEILKDIEPVDHSKLPNGADNMTAGKFGIKKLKIQLGLSCNYSCEYCSQRFVPHADQTGPEHIDAFVSGMSEWLDCEEHGRDLAIEFWGGEPFVYWKTLKPLAEAIRRKYAYARFSIITNGSLLDEEKINWIERFNFTVGISHDGPGQPVRGPDPLEDAESRAAILELFRRLHPRGMISFNSMLHAQNLSRSVLIDFFSHLTGARDVQVGEGGIIDPYDEGGLSLSINAEEGYLYRQFAVNEIRTDVRILHQMPAISQKVRSFAEMLSKRMPAKALGQKCGMDRPDQLAVDLNGNVLTCQNVSAASTNPAGVSHKLGTVGELKGIKIVSAQHWSGRDGCNACPVLGVCQGSCMFLSGPLFERACENAWNNSVPLFAVAFELVTGCLPVQIIGGRKDRENLWEPNSKPKARSFPVKFVSEVTS